jgi:hypothetical protein
MPDPNPFPPRGPTFGAGMTDFGGPGQTDPGQSSLLGTAREAASAVAQGAADLPGQVASGVSDAARRASAATAEGWDTATDYLGDQVEGLTQWMRRNPVPALCIGLGIGFGIGFLLARRGRL